MYIIFELVILLLGNYIIDMFVKVDEIICIVMFNCIIVGKYLEVI